MWTTSAYISAVTFVIPDDLQTIITRISSLKRGKMDVTIDPDSLQGMKYADLRTLAKSVGIRANMKVKKGTSSATLGLAGLDQPPGRQTLKVSA